MNTVRIPRILLPANADMQKWAVNACDQYTSDAEYWKKVKAATEGSPSAFKLIFPEIYLNDNPQQRIADINNAMREYLSGGVFRTVKDGLILVERTTASGTRTGIVLSIDLEDYSFKNGAQSLIRSTEATILERIPPRVEIRKNAEIELPHAMLLYDDKSDSVLNCVRRGEVLYDFDLLFNGGHVKGTYITNPKEVISALYALIDGDNASSGNRLLFAVGDGNHSLATAKTCWEELKKSLSAEQIKNHPARYALAEAVNIYDGALRFEPIHRLIKTDKPMLFAEGLKTSGGQKAYTVINGVARQIAFDADIPKGIRALDCYIAQFIREHGGTVDYVHGGQELKALTCSGGAGVLLPAIKKEDFFKTIICGGELPRKTFSMGEGDEKRFYIEAKLIK